MSDVVLDCPDNKSGLEKTLMSQPWKRGFCKVGEKGNVGGNVFGQGLEENSFCSSHGLFFGGEHPGEMKKEANGLFPACGLLQY